MKKTIKILIADDHKLIREGVKQLLALQKKFTAITDEAEDGREAIEMALRNFYDVIIMDIQMPEKNGIEATKIILEKNDKIKVLALSMFDEHKFIYDMLEAGASGYVLKNTGPEELGNAIVSVLNGKKYYSNEVAQKLIEQHYNSVVSSEKKPDDKYFLTRREKEIIRMIAQEKTSGEIAEILHVAKRTVDGHRERILDKLGVKNTAGIIKYAIKNNLIESSQNFEI